MSDSSAAAKPDFPIGNLLLAALPESERPLVLAQGQRIEARVGRELSHKNQPVRFIYFPLSGLVSMVVAMMDGSTIETSNLGREGVIGFPMGAGETAVADAVVAVKGQLLRIPTTRFLYLLSQTTELPKKLEQFEGALLQLVAQNAACNRLHSTEQRLSRWLVMLQDRVEASEYKLTHEFLAKMLGVRRASVSKAAEVFRKNGLINYRHGRVTIVDRPRLEAAACECYASVHRDFSELYS